jgi:hypothetical protein
MNVLLLHPEDGIPAMGASKSFDLIVDFARAPNATYERWSRQSGCPIISLYDFAEEMEDLYTTKELLKHGMAVMVDRSGIDWWGVLSLVIVPDLQNLILIGRLAEYLGAGCELYASRSFPLAASLQQILGRKLFVMESARDAGLNYLRHYFDVWSRLDIGQLCQVTQDKLDQRHDLRRRLAAPPLTSKKPVFLLPSGYINVSRMGASLANLLPEQAFLLVYARRSSKLKSVPANVQTVSLNSYFAPRDKHEAAALLKEWEILKQRLISSSPTFQAANLAGVFGKMPALLHWALALRKAWARVFELENVTACLCADDSNPYSRIPLMLAKQQAVPALALHHGALDLNVAIKTQHADFYAAKTAMECDYLLGPCRMTSGVVIGPAPSSKSTPVGTTEAHSDKPWLVFFTEPYQTGSWRLDEVYRELLPGLVGLAFKSGLKLVFKLHPFEGARAHIRMLRKFLPREVVRRIDVIAGPPSPEFWHNTRIALTVESTTALECTALGIPVFLCGWLRHYHGGYQEQYARFGFGHVLESVGEIADIPQLLKSVKTLAKPKPEPSMMVDPQILRELLTRGNTAREVVLA